MSTKESAQKPPLPRLVKLDKALKLAQQWVSNMTKSTDDESPEVQLEARSLRLGLGATVPRQSVVGPITDPVERKLHNTIKAGKRKATEELSKSASFGIDNKEDEDSDEDMDSRTNMFAKKRVVPSVSTLQKR